MRLKLEEEYNQNAKNHEEEVHLRMKFEAKLNEMHGELRDLNTRHNRTLLELEEAIEIKEDTIKQLGEKKNELVDLNQ